MNNLIQSLQTDPLFLELYTCYTQLDYKENLQEKYYVLMDEITDKKFDLINERTSIRNQIQQENFDKFLFIYIKNKIFDRSTMIALYDELERAYADTVKGKQVDFEKILNYIDSRLVRSKLSLKTSLEHLLGFSISTMEVFKFFVEALPPSENLLSSSAKYFYMKDSFSNRKLISDSAIDLIEIMHKSPLLYLGTNRKLISKYVDSKSQYEHVINQLDKQTKLLEQKLDKEIKDLPNIMTHINIIPTFYASDYEVVKKMLFLYMNKRADNIKELINLYEETEWRGALINSISKLTSEIVINQKNMQKQLSELNYRIENQTLNMNQNTKYLLQSLNVINQKIDNLDNMKIDVSVQIKD